MAYTAVSFVYGEVLTAAKMNILAANDASFHDGSGLPAITATMLADNAVTTAKINNGAVTRDKIDSSILSFGNYSTTEIDTGFKWIDSKAIYKRTYNFGSLPNNDTKFVDLNINNLGDVVDMQTIVSSSTSAHALNGIYGSSTNDNIFENCLITTNRTQIAITTKTDRSGYYAFITIYYTKTA